MSATPHPLDPFVPSAKAVEEIYAGSLVVTEGEPEEEYVAEFRRMLAAEKAKAWYEGMEAGQDAVITKSYTPNNPYEDE